MVLLPSTNLAAAEVVARSRITSVATQVVEVDGKLIRYTVVAGVALMDPDLSGIDCSMKRADQRCTWGRRMVAIAWSDGPTGSKFLLA